ncbi:SMI1/KNR4 family protein [Chryseobacterium fluminis]|uniref:SMI1/KNR4 family protein n=1 Tax=Chryseobacterium fluminis TaxID=2983606 RepID=UPI00225C2835|nr:SMI1/KNR4 family protein [Chryseobacterium sp. MMS21-Ot14]UZT96899.1 SMI1/KNR4 family protein [Chryseobacterium sp. MMS21-Ot14]
MERQFFKDFDFTGFWNESSYSERDYIEEFPDDAAIASIEEELGYKLPASYIELMGIQNGGLVNRSCFPTSEENSWADDHIAITGIMGIGREKTYSVCGELGSRFMIEEWGYPEDGIYICDCPSAGHDMILLDYSKCGKDGEPEVVHVDQEADYRKTFLAADFETFIKGLKEEEDFDLD